MIKDYVELTKPRITWLILMSAGVGFYLGSPAGLSLTLLLHALWGTALVASGTAALNQWMERETDSKMRRTRNRPLSAGRLPAASAFWFGILLALGGVHYLGATVNLLTALLGAFACLTYLVCYTPLKSRSTYSTLVGAFPGAMPILMGWTAATGRFALEGWILYGVLFLWQFPHFLAIGTLYCEDYARAGTRMLPVVHPDGIAAGRQIVGCTMALLLVSMFHAVLGVSSRLYLTGAAALGLMFLWVGFQASIRRTKTDARRLLLASVYYLPLIYGLMVINKLVGLR